jgi:gliding motility-associated protein GldM
LLVDYIKDLRSLSGLSEAELPNIAKAPKEMPMFKDDPDHAEKSFLVFNFENTPPIAALATVGQLEAEVMESANKALAALKARAGAEDLTFDQVVPMVRPEASIVAAGAKYKAEMFITASNSSYQPEFFRNGQKLEVISDPATGVKMGKVEFPATATSYDKDGLSKQTFKALIKLNQKDYEQDITYYVAQPIIRVTTGNAPTLYMNCGNNVNIEVPTLGTNYNPDFRPTGAEVRKGDKPGKVTIIPTQRKVTIAVSSGGVFIGNQPFDVKPIPRPHFEIKSGNQTVNMKDGVKSSSLTSLRVAAVPEENFKQEVPQDAVYRIRSMEVIHARGTAPVNRMTATNENIELGAWRSNLRPGDNIVIEVKTVTRKTFLGGDERVEVGTEIFRIPIQ